jgi:hypothetical protein
VPDISLRYVCSCIASAIVALIAAMYGYEFGLEVSGMLLGVIAGANCAIFGASITDAILSRMLVRNTPDPARE